MLAQNVREIGLQCDTATQDKEVPTLTQNSLLLCHEVVDLI